MTQDHPLDALLEPEDPVRIETELAETSRALADRLRVSVEDLPGELGRRLLAQEVDEDELMMRWMSLRAAALDWREAGEAGGP